MATRARHAAVALAALVVSSAAVCPAAAWLGPGALAVSRDGKTLYVACEDSRQIAWLELPGGRVVRRVDAPATPAALALSPDGARLYVACAAPKGIVATFDAATGRPLPSIAVGHTPSALAVAPDGRRLYAANRFDNDLSVIDLVACRSIARAPAVREPIAVAATPDGRAVVVANHLPDSRADDEYRGDVGAVVTLIDAATLAPAAIALPHGATGVRRLAISPDGKRALATHLMANFQKMPFRVDMGWINSNVVSVLDLVERRHVATIGMDENDLGAANPWDVAFVGRFACVSLAGVPELRVIEVEKLFSREARTMTPMMGVWPIYPSLGTSLWRKIALDGEGPRGLAAFATRVYVAQRFSDAVATVDLADETSPVVSLALGPPPRPTLERRGEMLFHDARLCYQQWQSCASCHPDALADGLNWDLLNDGAGNAKNTKSMALSHRTPPAMAEGVRMSAEEAVRSGIRHVLFSERPEEEAVALDAWLKSLEPVPSPRLVDGQSSAAAQRGKALFERLGCGRCHPAPLYTDLREHDVGSRGPNERTERFDTPTLVEAWRTAPYLHDGRWRTLGELFVEGRHGLRGREPLSAQELVDLTEYVGSL